MPIPRRPRTHELEAESRAVWDRTVPSRWVTRWLDQDYGVDGETELFQDGMATSVKFNVQLKSTDERDLHRALGVRVELDTVDYLRSLAFPTLIVRYMASSDEMYVRWLHSFPYELTPEQETVTLRLGAEDRWDGTAAASIEREAIALHRWRQSDPARPLFVRVESGVLGRPARSVVRELREHSTGFDDEIAFTTSDEHDAVLLLSLNEDGMRTAFLEFASMSWGFGDYELRGPELSSTVQLQIAIVCAISGKQALAARILRRFEPRSPLVGEFRSAFAVGAILGEAGDLDNALRVAYAAAAAGVGCDAVRTIEAGLRGAGGFAGRTLLENQKMRAYYRFMTRHETCSNRQRAALHYSFGNLLFNQGSYRESFRQLRRAAVLNPAYCDREYWLREIGAALFENNRFGAAVRAYQAVQDMPDRVGDHRHVLADALARAGRYGDALQQLDSMATDNPQMPTWAKIKHRCLQYAVRRSGISAQARQADEAAAKVGQLVTAGILDPSRLQQILDADLLCHKAWHAVGRHYRELGAEEQAFLCFTMAFDTDPHCIEGAVDAVLAATGDNTRRAAAIEVMTAASEVHGTAVLDLIVDAGTPLPTDLMQAIGELEVGFESSAAKRYGLEMRVVFD